MIELTSLFFASLLVSTIIPGGVEPYLYLLYQQGYGFVPLLIVATAGNTIGGIITFLIGGLLFKGVGTLSVNRKITRFFRVSDRSVKRLQRYGIPLLLLSWVPIIGDPLVLAGGYLRFQFWPSMLAILIGKFARYLGLLWLFS